MHAWLMPTLLLLGTLYKLYPAAAGAYLRYLPTREG